MSLLKAGAGFVIALTLASLLIPSYASGASKKRKRSVGGQQSDVVQDNGDLLRVFKKQEEYRYLVGNAQLLKPEHIKAAYHLMQKEQPKSELKKKIDEGLKTVQHPEIDVAFGAYFWVKRLRNDTVDSLLKQDPKLVEMYGKIRDVYNNDGLSLVGECHAVDAILEDARKKGLIPTPNRIFLSCSKYVDEAFKAYFGVKSIPK